MKKKKLLVFEVVCINCSLVLYEKTSNMYFSKSLHKISNVKNTFKCHVTSSTYRTRLML